MNLKDIKVQVLFQEDSMPRVINAELTFKGIHDLEILRDGFAAGFTKWLMENNYHDACILDDAIINELLKMYKKEKGL